MLTLKTCFGGAEIDLCHPQIRRYLNMTDPAQMAAFLSENDGIRYDRLTFSAAWEDDGSEQYTVLFAEDPELSGAVTFHTTAPEFINRGIFIPGHTYWWQVRSARGNASPTDCFTVKNAPVRYLSFDAVGNVRDLGGWQTASGLPVPYGRIYRGNLLNPEGGLKGLTPEDRRVFTELLGIRSELDLRIPGHDDGGQNTSVLGDSVTYAKLSLPSYSHILPSFVQTEPRERAYDEKNTAHLCDVFEFLADEAHYPVYLHCNAGADRTGTLAFLINGLLGVSVEDLTRDFEITSFSPGGRRWRSAIVDGAFDSFGVMQDDDMNYVGWNRMLRELTADYGGDTLAETIETYLQTVCEISPQTLAAVRRNMNMIQEEVTMV